MLREGGDAIFLFMTKLYNLEYLKDLRRQLRNSSTNAESVLWQYLKGEQLGMKFRRQTSIGRYIVDFCCKNEKLIIELEGEIHEHPDVAEYDEEREIYLKSLGFKIIFFKNQEVIENPKLVVEKIKKFLENSQLPPTSSVACWLDKSYAH